MILRLVIFKIIFLLIIVGNLIAQDKPNVVFIFADDLSSYDIGAYGNDEVRTPNIDKLADSGLKFTRAYNMGSWSPAVCIASRTMLNTGRFLWNAQKLAENNYQTLHDQNEFWSESMSQAGYTTYFTGKWHVPGLDPSDIFDHVVNVRPGMPNQTEEGYNRPQKNKEDVWSPYNPEFEGFWSGGIHWSEVLSNDADKFINHAAENDKPFFMYLAFNAPHDPRQSPKEYVDSYDPNELKIPENFLPEYPYKNPIGSGRTDERYRPHPPGTPQEVIESSQYLRDEWLAPFPRTEYAISIHRQEFYAIISHMDSQIGKVLDSLKEKNLLDNTIIIFTADHGLSVGRHGLLGKQNMYEHSLRVPFIITGPDIPINEANDTPVYLQDIVPTTIEFAGEKVPNSYQFKTLLPLINDGNSDHYSAIYGAYLQHQRSIIDWPYKLILYPTISKIRLFNIQEDPHEINDLAEISSFSPIIKKLMNLLIEKQKITGDQLDLASFYSEWI